MKKIKKVEKLVATLHDKNEYVIRIRNLKQALHHGLVLKKVHRVIKFTEKARLKSYIEMNTELIKKQKMISQNVGINTDIKLVATKKRRNYLVPGPNYHSTKFFTENISATEIRKTQIFYE